MLQLYTCLPYRSLIKSKVMPALGETEEEDEEEDAESKDPLPEKLQNSMVNLTALTTVDCCIIYNQPLGG